MANPATAEDDSGTTNEMYDAQLPPAAQPDSGADAPAMTGADGGALIVLDTNLLDKTGFPSGAVLLMLRKLAKHHGHTLAVPEMVAVEHTAHHRYDIDQALTAARRALGTLGAAFDQPLGEILNDLSSSGAAEVRHGELRAFFAMLPTPDGAALEALEREANRRPPAESVWVDAEGKSVKARGARDVVIWLTLLATAATYSGEVWFVSADGDFAGRDDFHPVLRAEAIDHLGPNRAARLQLLRGFPALLQRLADKVDLRHTDVDTLLAGVQVAEVVREFINGPVAFFSLSARVLPPAPSGSFLFSVAAVVAFDKRLGEPHAYRVGERVWVTARARWRAGKTFLQLTSDSPASAEGPVATERHSARVQFSFTTTVLIELDAAGADVLGATVLAISPFELRGGDEQAGNTDGY